MSSCGRDDKDKKCRQANLEDLKKTCLVFDKDKIPMESVLPNFGPSNCGVSDKNIRVLVGADDIRSFGEKLTRGAIYSLHNQYVERTHEVEISINGERYSFPIVIGEIKKFPLIDKFIYGLHIISAYDSFAKCGVVILEIWDRLQLLALIEPAENKLLRY